MKHRLINHLVSVSLLVVPVILVAGCPLDNMDFPLTESLEGWYWVEYHDGLLSAYELPEYRGEDGRWITLETTEPVGFTGPGLYEVDADGNWTMLVSGENETLDDFLQTYDPQPRP